MFNRLALALMASASLAPFSAYAQTNTDNRDTGVSSEVIVVTAQKREELLREVPQSVTAVTGETLELLQANSLEEYASRVPGMVATGTQPGNTRLVLRGLNNEGIGASVATYIDETPFGSSTALVNGAALALDFDPFDIERIEVLRGPQGTLYGANAMAGLIKFVTRDPDFEDFELRVRGTGESTEDGEESWAMRASANIPLGGQAGLRVSAFKRSVGGFIDSVEDTNSNGAVDAGEPRNTDDNGVEISGLRATFMLQATDDLSFRVSAFSQEIESENFSQIQYNVSPGPNRTATEPTHGDLLRLGPDFPLGADTTYNVLNATVDWDLGWASLISSSSVGELDQYRLQGDLEQRLDQDLTQDKFTQEIRLASPSSDRFEWMLGYYYTQENGLIHQYLDAAGLVESLGFTSVLAGIFEITEQEVLDLSTIDLTVDSEYTEHAFFGEGTYKFTPQFDLTVGARYAQNDQRVIQGASSNPVSDFLFGLVGGDETSTEEVTTFSISPRLRPSDRTMVYARVASGFRPGGPNLLVTGSAIPSTFDSDTLVNYELGVKTDIIDNLLRLDASVFHIDWKDIQLLVAEDTPGGLLSGNSNGGAAISEGVEWTATLTPFSGFSVLWSGAYTDARLDGEQPANSVLRLREGDSLPFSPKWSSAIDVDYEWVAFGDTRAYVGGGANYVGDQMSDFALIFDDPTDLVQIELPSYTLIDLRAGLRFENATLELFARNIGDERAPVRMGPSADFGQAAVLRPRTIGVSLSATF